METARAAPPDDGTLAVRPAAAVDSSTRPSHDRPLPFGEITGTGGREQDILGESAQQVLSRQHFDPGAASSRASGSASSRRQIAVTARLLAAVRRKSGCTSRARSTKSRTAGRARSTGDAASTFTSSASGPTAYPAPPRTRSGARLVASTRSGATAVRRSATSAAASRTCSNYRARATSASRRTQPARVSASPRSWRPARRAPRRWRLPRMPRSEPRPTRRTSHGMCPRPPARARARGPDGSFLLLLDR